jgi:hypothetical protein
MPKPAKAESLCFPLFLIGIQNPIVANGLQVDCGMRKTVQNTSERKIECSTFSVEAVVSAKQFHNPALRERKLIENQNLSKL